MIGDNTKDGVPLDALGDLPTEAQPQPLTIDNHAGVAIQSDDSGTASQAGASRKYFHNPRGHISLVPGDDN